MILRKLMSVFMIAIIVTFSLVAFMLYSLVGDYAIKEKKENLTALGVEIVSTAEQMLQENIYKYPDVFDMSFKLLSRNVNCEIIMADRNGKVLVRTFLKYPDDKIEIMPEVLVSAINTGEHADMTGDLIGISKKALAVGVPLKYKEQVVAGVYMITNLPDLTGVRYDILVMYITSFVFAVIISFVLAYLFSRKITAPIKAIKKAANDFSCGLLDTRIDVKAKDELRFLAEAFNEMADSLSKAEKMRTSFISDISHELRTPMTTIIGFVQGILDDTIPYEKQNMYLQIVLDETKRLSRLVSDLLESSKFSSDNFKLEKTSFDINEQLRITMIAFEKRFEKKHLLLNATFMKEKEIVFADKDCIKRVLTNLIDNAVKFSYDGGKIDIKTVSDENEVTVSVMNEGEGITDDIKSSVFERFYKSDKSRSKNTGGVGLGLSIVKSILNKHGEKITVRSEPGKYAEFSFKLKKYKN